MSAIKHQPGEWRATRSLRHGSENPSWELSAFDAAGNPTLIAHKCEEPHVSDAANFALLKAAPLMLAALEEMVARREAEVKRCGLSEEWRDGSDGRYIRARSAIAIAEGRE